MKLIKKWFLVVLIISALSCESDNEIVPIQNTDDTTVFDEDALTATLDLPITAFNYANINLPGYFLDNDLNAEDNTPGNNPITDEGATLGRVLFYDKKMSLNNTVSCASCHIQANSFSDPRALSVGFEGGLTGRNSMGLANAKFYNNGRFFWDERANTLEDQVLLPIQDHVEMGMALTELETKLAQEEYYSVLFTKAFGDANVTSNRISLALAQFVRSMVSYESKYDEGMAITNNTATNFPNFTASENLGKELFFSNRTRCSQCHITNAFVGDRARNTGLDLGFSDLGVGGVTGNANENGRFKVPSLRNIELTGPYMHDGRFATLARVIDFYDNEVQDNPNLDNRLRQGNGVRRLNLSNVEKQALVDFLNTLTDDHFITDEKYGDPFINQ